MKITALMNVVPYFGLSRTTFKNRLKEYSIHKDKDAAIKLSKQKLEEKYGKGYNPLSDREKIKNTLIEKYGADNPMKVKEIREKAEKTNIERYGCKVPLQNEDIFNKMVATNIKKYGVACSLKNEEVREKAFNTCIDVYGNKYPLASDNNLELLNKRKETNLKKYGADEITKSEYFKDIIKKRCLEKYGTTSPNESIHSETTFLNIDNFKKYLSETFLDKKPTVSDICKNTKTSDTYVLNKIHSLKAENLVILKPTTSECEKNIYEYILSLGIDKSEIVCKDKTVLNGLEIDILLKKYNLGVEVNGIYYHSDIFKDKKYHQNKSIASENAGIRLIHIYDYEWEDPLKNKIIKSILKSAVGLNKKVYARKCTIKEVNKKDMKDFLNNNHLQGYRGCRIAYGLYFNDELLEVMSFGKHNKYGWEIIRSATKIDYTIVGGASRLFKKFISDKNPEQVFSYCDYNKFNGNGYLKLGMEYLGLTVPDMKWVINGKVFNRNPSKNTYLKGKAEYRLYGSGSKKYIWKRNGGKNE